MKLTGRYTIGELRSLIGESADGKTTPKYGNTYNANSEKRENEKAVRDILKDVDKHHPKGDGKKDIVADTEDVNDMNYTTLDYRFGLEPADSYKMRVKDLALYGRVGKPSKETEEDGGSDFEGNKKFYDTRKKINKDRNKNLETLKKSGLAAREIAKDNPDFYKTNSLFKESKNTIKRLHFKNSVFLSEAAMIKKIPDSYKTDGNTFIMKDGKGNEYLVECRCDEKIQGLKRLDVKYLSNTEKASEQIVRMNNLTDYKYSNNKKNNGTTVNESVEDTLNKVRRLQQL